jgi:hypothetical protein
MLSSTAMASYGCSLNTNNSSNMTTYEKTKRNKEKWISLGF